MDLSTTYLGLRLPHPLMPGASPLTEDLDGVRRMEDAGAAAIVLPSLFEEQITGEQLATHHYLESSSDSFAEALSYLPHHPDLTLGPEQHLEHTRRVKEAVDVPIIASINGTTHGGWLTFAGLLEEMGADALELNMFQVPVDPTESGELIEARMLEVVQAVVGTVDIPVAVKLSACHTSIAHFARRLDEEGASGLILFNRFHEVDIDAPNLEVVPTLRLSDPTELHARLTWLSVLASQVSTSLAVTGGVHSGIGAAKAVMCGAHAVQLVSVLLREGPEHLAVVRDELVRWMEENEYASLDQMRGCMSLSRCPDPRVFERSSYMRLLHSWRGFV